MMTPTDLRQSFVDFFAARAHTHVPSSSLIPDDPTLPFFVNAGMNQFVPFFLGRETPPFSPGRAANSQKCIRAGGKHNDLEDVGFDTYHHTFFEMLGNWSFGDYFKREAILWCWELLTEQWGFPKERLYFTVYKPGKGEPGETDVEAYEIWKEICVNAGLDPEVHVIFAGKADNFWMMGDTGPCGPCSEVHIDLTPEGKTAGKLVNQDDHRCIEIWNLVFIQNNATPDGRFEDLPAKHVDTGMGFERACAAMQCTNNFTDFSKPVSNYNTEVFTPIFAAISALSGKSYASTLPKPGEEPAGQVAIDIAFRVIGDHVRCLTAAIADGIYPDKTGRGYVMRRILRRAVRYGRTLDLHEPFLCKLAEVVIDQLGPIFPSIAENRAKVIQYLRAEEESFGRTLDRGLDLFAAVREKVTAAGETAISGADAFELYDTFGFPLDLTELMAREIGLTVDVAGFNVAMEQQRKRAQDAQKKTLVVVEDGELELGETAFTGFDALQGPAMIKHLVPAGDSQGVVFDRSPFYVEMGGQVGDSGELRRGSDVIAIRDTQKMAGGIVHLVDAAANLKVGDVVDLAVDAERRQAIERHHTVTHLLHWAIREVLGKDASQRGSFVGPDYLRFDFNHLSGLTADEAKTIEDLVNQRIMENAPVYWFEQDRESIRGNSEINQFFGDKYGDSVRIVQIGGVRGELNGYSMELCGGTHTRATGVIGPFVLKHEAAISAGIRRIEAIAGAPARAHLNNQLALLDRVAQTVGAPLGDLEKRIESLLETQKRLEKELKTAAGKLAQSAAADLVSLATELNGVPALVADVSALDASPADLLDSLQAKFPDGVIVLGGAANGACTFATAVPAALVKQGHNAGTLAREAAKVTGGGGGGSPQKAKAGGRDAAKLPDALEKTRQLIAGA